MNKQNLPTEEIKLQVIVVNSSPPEFHPIARVADAPILVVEKTPVEKINIEEAITNICKMRDAEQMNKNHYKKK